MTPEQLAHLRQWAEWGESPTPETTIALLDHIAWWEGQFKRVQHGLTAHSNKLWAIRKLHQPIKGLNAPNCIECNRNTTTADILADYGTPYPCPTIQALEGDPDGSQ